MAVFKGAPRSVDLGSFMDPFQLSCLIFIRIVQKTVGLGNFRDM